MTGFCEPDWPSLRCVVKQLGATRHNVFSKFSLKDLLLSTDRGAVLHSDEASMIASFLVNDWATIEDLEAIGANEPTVTGLCNALFCDCVNTFDVSSFALLGFKHAIVTEKMWRSFLLSIAKSEPKFLMYAFFTLTRIAETRTELFPTEEVLDAVFTSKVATCNLLGYASRICMSNIDTMAVARLKGFVTPQYFDKLANGRQFDGLLPIHDCVAYSRQIDKKVPSVGLLRSLLPDDNHSAKRLDLAITNEIGSRLSFPEFVRQIFQSEDKRRLRLAVREAVCLMGTLELGTADSQ